ncbi:hypothetical protein F5H01DRAFT_349967 [Linnemannia elongata]|nr:hypothetical protein F5H01DRAFT_349967 [Linnemannia elongata]
MEQQQHLQQQQQLHHQQQQQQLQQQQQQQQQQALVSNGGGGGGPRLSSSIASPTSIFPSDAFTFTAPIFHPGLGAGQAGVGAFQSIFPGQEGGIGQQMAVDSLKRRYALQDFNTAASRMMSGTNNQNNNINSNLVSNNGRMMANQPLNLNLMDSFGAFHDQPPFKRGRRREGE